MLSALDVLLPLSDLSPFAETCCCPSLVQDCCSHRSGDQLVSVDSLLRLILRGQLVSGGRWPFAGRLGLSLPLLFFSGLSLPLQDLLLSRFSAVPPEYCEGSLEPHRVSKWVCGEQYLKEGDVTAVKQSPEAAATKQASSLQ